MTAGWVDCDTLYKTLSGFLGWRGGGLPPQRREDAETTQRTQWREFSACFSVPLRLCGGKSASRFHPAPQYFRDAPGLRDAASRGVWGLGVEDFADAPDALLIQV